MNSDLNANCGSLRKLIQLKFFKGSTGCLQVCEVILHLGALNHYCIYNILYDILQSISVTHVQWLLFQFELSSVFTVAHL